MRLVAEELVVLALVARACIGIGRAFEVVLDVVNRLLQQVQVLGNARQLGQWHLRDGLHERLGIGHRLLNILPLILFRQVLLHALVEAVQTLAEVLAQLLKILAGITAVRTGARMGRVHDDGLRLDQAMLRGHLQALGDQLVHQLRILEPLSAETGQAARVDHLRLLRRQTQEALVRHVVTGLLHHIDIGPVINHLD